MSDSIIDLSYSKAPTSASGGSRGNNLGTVDDFSAQITVASKRNGQNFAENSMRKAFAFGGDPVAKALLAGTIKVAETAYSTVKVEFQTATKDGGVFVFEPARGNRKTLGPGRG